MLAAQPDRVVCALALRGHSAAFEVLYERYHRPVYAFTFHLLGRGASAEDAEDIAQETFSTAFSKLSSRREEGSFKTWLFTIARNRAFDHLRASKPQPADVSELTIAGAADTERDVESKAQMTWLVSAMHELPPRQREALVMKELGGLSLGEIAAGMKTTPSGVKQLLNRARNGLGDAAEGSGFSRRRLRGELNSVVPVLPIVASGGGLAALGIGGGTATAGAVAGAGGLSAGAKAAAVLLTVASIGGGTVGVKQVAGGDRSVPVSSRTAGSGAGGSGGDGAGQQTAAAPQKDNRERSGNGGEKHSISGGEGSHRSRDDRRTESGSGDGNGDAGQRNKDSSPSGDENAGKNSGDDGGADDPQGTSVNSGEIADDGVGESNPVPLDPDSSGSPDDAAEDPPPFED